MSKLSEIIKERSTPGILIFDLHGRLIYSNQEALEMQAVLQSGEAARMTALEEIYYLCRQLNKGTDTPDAIQGVAPENPVLSAATGHSYSLRSFVIGEHAKENKGTHILILIERVVERHKVDIEKARREFQLTKREAEVVILICQGLSNREISETKFISEYTVKVHIKNIMKKMKTGSRNEISALLK
jgi:ATP/maltotriose-dependent transcriptional regulator MalT